MDNQIELTGMVILNSPVGDYNKRVVILTGESGKITAFARGARRMGSKYMGVTEPFCFGHFKLIRGKEAYTFVDANITKHFEEMRGDYEATIIGSYFLEIADYYTRENMEAYQELNLLYASLLALMNDKFDRRLVQAIYEIKSICVAGEFPGIPTDRPYSDTARYTLDRIVNSEIKELYSFSVTSVTLEEIVHIGKYYIDRLGHKFKSLDLL